MQKESFTLTSFHPLTDWISLSVSLQRLDWPKHLTNLFYLYWIRVNAISFTFASHLDSVLKCRDWTMKLHCFFSPDSQLPFLSSVVRITDCKKWLETDRQRMNDLTYSPFFSSVWYHCHDLYLTEEMSNLEFSDSLLLLLLRKYF